MNLLINQYLKTFCAGIDALKAVLAIHELTPFPRRLGKNRELSFPLFNALEWCQFTSTAICSSLRVVFGAK